MFVGHWLPIWFTCTQTSLAEYLAAQRCSMFLLLKLHLPWFVLWPLGFADFSLHRLSQIFVRNALLFVVSDNPMYTWSSTPKFHCFCNVFKWRRGASMWNLNFLHVVTVKFGVLMAILRNEAWKSRRNLPSFSVVTCAFQAKKIIEKMNGHIKKFEVIYTLLHPPFI